jgi:hypothetical protein
MQRIREQHIRVGITITGMELNRQFLPRSFRKCHV